MDFVFYLAQGISVLTAIVAIFIMQFKSMRFILLGQIAVNVLTATTYFLLGGFSGAGICFIAIIQTVVMFVYDSKNVRPHIPVIIVFIISYVACSAYYFKSFIDVFSALAAIFFAISVTQKKPSASSFMSITFPETLACSALFASGKVSEVPRRT